MQTFLQIIVAVFAVFILWRMVSYLRKHPDLLSKEKLSQSFTTAGILALILIGAVFMMVMLLK